MTNHKRWLRKYGAWLPVTAAMLALLLPAASQAADSGGSGFNIQVSPSPLAVRLNPGERQTATITVRNLSNHSETLVPGLSGFAMGKDGEKIDLKSEVPLGLDQWIKFKQQTLTVAPGGSQPLEIIYDTPSNVGFSYALAITLNQADTKTESQGATLKASVAVFNLININRPDAKRELEIQSFKSDKSSYEYLPAGFTLSVRNNGNVIDQPTGNLFIQRSFDDAEPIATIPINQASSYILPGTSRNLNTNWEDGFPRHVTTQTGGVETTKLSWNWKELNSLRMGKYVAKVVLVYNDGHRDIPLIASVSFWVIPWKLILVTLVVGGLVVTGLVAWVRILLKGTSRVRKYARRK